VRSLFVLYPGSPLPLSGGGPIRYWNLLGALREVGDVDVWLVDEPDASRIALLAEASGARVGADRVVPRPFRPSQDLEWLFRSTAPRWPDADLATMRARFDSWRAPRYDIVLSAESMCFEWLARRVPGRAVVDFGDVPDLMHARGLRLAVRDTGPRAVHPRTAYRFAREWVNIARHRRLLERLRSERVEFLTCSERDAAHVGGSVTVVPNGYERSGPPVGRLQVATRPVLLMQGTLAYEPNRDAAVYFARDVLPRVRATRPDARFLLAGNVDDNFRRRIERFPGVEVLGFVDRIEDVLATADLVVAPLRLGGGTRIKILEAFSHRIPVVATTVGVEGIDAVPGEHLLVADRPEGLTRACLTLLEDVALRARLADAAAELVETRYSWPGIRSRLTHRLQELCAVAPVP
jgi:glycosyltransferase involved in cell wall biosynthesis